MGRRFRVLVVLLALSGLGLAIGSALGRRGGEGRGVVPPSVIPGAQGRVRVEVLNASGLAGVAWDATRTLRDRGFDVVYYGNAGTYTTDSSVVMDRVGELESARSVAETLGIVHVLSDPDSSRFVDVTVRLGPDWSGPQGTVDEPQESSAWWNLGRFFRGRDPAEPQ